VDRELYASAQQRLAAAQHLPIPEQAIPAGDETTRLLRWGYRRYRDMFNDRQLFGLGTLFERIQALSDRASREALLTVFSDALRYQNMLCRYDTYALKCQDVFSVHGFPVREQPPRHSRRRLRWLLSLRGEVPSRQSLLSRALREPREREQAPPPGDFR
jgi:hypothetical protein